MNIPDCDIIGGFPVTDPYCAGCGEPLALENAWMTDGCPCNHALGVNSMNETRWRLLMQLQQRQQHENEAIKLRLLSAAGDDLCRLAHFRTLCLQFHLAGVNVQIDRAVGLGREHYASYTERSAIST